MSCGIYKWTSPSGKSYIGQSVNLEYRKQDFITNKLYTTTNKCSLTVIDKARKKYPDFEQWTYEILEYCEPIELNDMEQYYINLFGTFKNGYNETSGGGQNFEFSDETKEKIRQANLGKTLSDETKEKLRQANLGRTHSDEAKEKISKGNKGKIVSDEAKEKIRQAHIGKTHSDEAKEKLRQANLGKTHSDETKEKISKANKGRIMSDEHKVKIGKANKGKTLSDEHKEKLRQAHIGKTLSDEHKENIGKGNKGKIPWNKGKHRSQESLKKLSESLKGHIGYNRKQVDQYSLDGTFIKTWDSILQVEKELGYKNGGICKCCKGKQKTSNGFIWRYHN